MKAGAVEEPDQNYSTRYIRRRSPELRGERKKKRKRRLQIMKEGGRNSRSRARATEETGGKVTLIFMRKERKKRADGRRGKIVS